MSPDRYNEIDAKLTDLGNLGFDTDLYDELLAEVDRQRAMLTVVEHTPTEISMNLRFGGAIGRDHTNGCFVCGAGKDPYDNVADLGNISGFVPDRGLGLFAVEWFRGQGARLDYRSFEPNWLQLKIGACKDHKQHLELLAKHILHHKSFSQTVLGLIRDTVFEKTETP
jgi:hypothetical protein